MMLHMRSQQVVRIEQPGESAIDYPTLNDAMRSAPSHSEAQIATSLGGVVLAEAALEPCSSEWLCPHYYWRPTVAGLDVLHGCVRGLERVA